MVKEIAYSIMTPAQISEFENTLECNFAIGQRDLGRFRVNVFKQRGELGMVVPVSYTHLDVYKRHVYTQKPASEIMRYWVL